GWPAPSASRYFTSRLATTGERMTSTGRRTRRFGARSSPTSPSRSPADPLTPADRRFLLRQRVAHLATSSSSGAPHIVPIVFALEDCSLYFVVDEKPKRSRQLKRLRNLAENPRAAVIVDHYDDDWRRLRFVLLHGAAALVTNAEEYRRVLRRLRRRYPQ